MRALLLASLLILSPSLLCQAVGASSQLDRLITEVSALSQNLDLMKETFSASLAGIANQLTGISHKLDAKFPVRVMRTRGMGEYSAKKSKSCPDGNLKIKKLP